MVYRKSCQYTDVTLEAVFEFPEKNEIHYHSNNLVCFIFHLSIILVQNDAHNVVNSVIYLGQKSLPSHLSNQKLSCMKIKRHIGINISVIYVENDFHFTWPFIHEFINFNRTINAYSNSIKMCMVHSPVSHLKRLRSSSHFLSFSALANVLFIKCHFFLSTTYFIEFHVSQIYPP